MDYIAEFLNTSPNWTERWSGAGEQFLTGPVQFVQGFEHDLAFALQIFIERSSA